MLKKFVKAALILIVLIVLVFLAARYGWRLFGFNHCSASVYASDVSVADDLVKISGGTAESAPSYVGYIYKISDGNLYVGVKNNLLFGFFTRSGSFDIAIKTDASKIERIYLKGGDWEKLIWEKG